MMPPELPVIGNRSVDAGLREESPHCRVAAPPKCHLTRRYCLQWCASTRNCLPTAATTVACSEMRRPCAPPSSLLDELTSAHSGVALSVNYPDTHRPSAYGHLWPFRIVAHGSTPPISSFSSSSSMSLSGSLL